MHRPPVRRWNGASASALSARIDRMQTTSQPPENQDPEDL
jgi:hypothetical protein